MSITPTWTGGDDTVAVQAALNDGRAIDGEGRIYNVTGVVGNPGQTIYDLRLRDIGGNRTNKRTLYFPDGTGIDIRVHIDRNGDGAYGSWNDAGLWVEGPANTEDWAPFYDAKILARVKGAGLGHGIVVNRPERFDLEAYVKEITWSAPSMPLDDKVGGVWIRGGAKNGRQKAIVADCGGYVNGVFTKRFARNIVLSKTEQVLTHSSVTIGGDVGMDFTGSDYNYLDEVVGCAFVDSHTYGMKIANSGYGVEVSDTKIVRSGSHGMIVSGPVGAVNIPTAYCRGKGVHVLNPGYGGNWTAQLPAGFMVAQGLVSPTTYPFETEFIDCFAQDNQPTKTMYDGFRAQNSARKNTACRSIGHTNSAFNGTWVTV